MASLNRSTGTPQPMTPPRLAVPATREWRLDDTTSAPEQRAAVAYEQRLRRLEATAASIAHGLNTLLGAVAAESAHLLDDASDDDETVRRNGLRTIHQAALDAAGLTRRLLRESRGEPLDDAETLEPIDLAAIIGDAVELTRSRWQAQAAGQDRPIDLVVEAADSLLVMGRSADLREVVSNLILNAVDAMPQGGHLLLRGAAQDGSVIVRCQDSGVGMSPDVLARVREPFFTTKGSQGTGLGLPIVYDVVARLGGEVRIASAEDTGTTVTLIVPTAEHAHGPLDSAASRAATADGLAASLAPLSILVVEDDAVFRAAFTRRLGLDARRADAVPDAASALAALDAEHWDLLCIDEGLPDRPGRELAAEVRRLRPKCAVILVTGAATGPDDPSLAVPEIDAILPKPCTDAELGRALRTACARQAEARPLLV